MPLWRSVDLSSFQGFVASRARASPSSLHICTPRHEQQAAPSSTIKHEAVRLDLFGWQMDRQAMKTPQKTNLYAVHVTIIFSSEPSAPDFDLLDMSAPHYSSAVFANASAPPSPLTPSSSPWTITNSYEPSAPMLTPTSGEYESSYF